VSDNVREVSKIMARLFAASLLFSALSVFAQSQSTPAQDHARRASERRVHGDLEGALVEYDKALSADPRAASIYVKRGGVRRAKGDLEGALSDYDAAYALDPRSVQNDRFVADAFSDRGNVRTSKLDMDGALADYNKALFCYQGNPDLYLKRGQARLINGDYTGALTDLDSGLALKPDDKLASIAYAVRGYVNVRRGDDEAARRDFDQSLKLNREGRLFLHLHLLNLDSQFKELKRRRALDEQRIS
jgi:tetratricopeptide (TPR) repeat protein